MPEWKVPEYTELKRIGSGGFGDVVLARHDASRTLVAIKYLRHDLFDVVEILLGLERVVDPVVALLVEFFIRNLRIGAEVRAPGRLYQAVRHESAG